MAALRNYHDFLCRTVTDYDDIDAGGQVAVADAFAVDVENADGLAVGTVNYNAAVFDTNLDFGKILLGDAYAAVFDDVGEESPYRILAVGLGGAAGNDEGGIIREEGAVCERPHTRRICTLHKEGINIRAMIEGLLTDRPNTIPEGYSRKGSATIKQLTRNFS